MNVSKIQVLSEQYEALKSFHETCNENDVQLIAKRAGSSFGEQTLGTSSTELIIVAVRKALLETRKKLMAEIKEEAEK
jgi:hypothetical protein